MSRQSKRVLVVEDDRELGLRLCQDLKDAGLVPLGPMPTAHYASQLLGRRTVDAAILDTLLYGQTVFELANELDRRGIPFIFLKDPNHATLPPSFAKTPCLDKPCSADRILSAFGSLPGFGALRAAPVLTSEPDTADTDVQIRMIRTICKILREDGSCFDKMLGETRIAP